MKIDKGVPIPGSSGSKSAWANDRWVPHETFKAMDIGDSVFFEGATHMDSPRVLARYHGKKLGYRFTAKVVDGGLRIWRVK